MHTQVDLPDDLLQQAMKIVERDGKTLDALIEEGLRAALRRRSWKKPIPPSRAIELTDDLGLDERPRWGQAGA